MKYNLIKKIAALCIFFAMSIENVSSTTHGVGELACKAKDILHQTKSYFTGYKHHLEDHLDFLKSITETNTFYTEISIKSIEKNIVNADSYIEYTDITLRLFDFFNQHIETPQTSKSKLIGVIENSITHFLLTRLNNLCERMTTKIIAKEQQALGNCIVYLESTEPREGDFEVDENNTDTIHDFGIIFNAHARKNILDLYYIMSNTPIELSRLIDLRTIRNSELKRVIRCSPSLWGAFTGESDNIYHPDYVNETWNEWESYCDVKEGTYLDEERYPTPDFIKPRKVLQEAKPVVDDWLADTKPSSQKKAVKKLSKNSQKNPKHHNKPQQPVIETVNTKPSASEVVETMTDVMQDTDTKVKVETTISVTTLAGPVQPTVSARLKKAQPQKQPSPERTVVAAAPINVLQTNPLETRVLSLKGSLQTVYDNIMNNIQFSYTNLCSLWTALGGTVVPAPGGGSHCKLKYGDAVIGGAFRPHGADGFGPRCRGDIKDIFNTLGQHLSSLGA